jgi:hypothetical protein
MPGGIHLWLLERYEQVAMCLTSQRTPSRHFGQNAWCASMGSYGRRSILGDAHTPGFIRPPPTIMGRITKHAKWLQFLVSRGVNFRELRIGEVRRNAHPRNWVNWVFVFADTKRPEPRRPPAG